MRSNCEGNKNGIRTYPFLLWTLGMCTVQYTVQTFFSDKLRESRKSDFGLTGRHLFLFIFVSTNSFHSHNFNSNSKLDYQGEELVGIEVNLVTATGHKFIYYFIRLFIRETHQHNKNIYKHKTTEHQDKNGDSGLRQ